MDDMQPFRKLEFWDAWVCELEEQHSAYSGAPMRIRCLISAATLRYNKSIVFQKNWYITEIDQKRITQTEQKTEPKTLITSVEGKSLSFPNETVEYSVTRYNKNNITNTDKSQISWIVKVDGKEYRQEQKGEKLQLKIKDEWVDKEIVVMPYLHKNTEKVSVKTKIENRLSLLFNGEFLIFQVVDQDQIQRFTFKAVSGEPIDVSDLGLLANTLPVVKEIKANHFKDGPHTFDYSRERQKVSERGPIPEGNYYINPQEIQYSGKISTLKKIEGEFFTGNFKGGSTSWGIARVWIEPHEINVDGVTRKGFTIHGGTFKGSSGCIDLTSNDKPFFEALEKYKGISTKVPLIVKYTVKQITR